MIVTINGAPIISGTVEMPVSGVWVGRVVLSGEHSLSGPVSLSDGTVSLSGTVVDSDLDGPRTRAHIRGGTGDLAGLVDSRNYTRPAVKLVMGDMARDTGFGVSPATQPQYANATLPFWTTVSLPLGSTMETLAQHLDTRWGVDSSGGLLLGYDPSEVSPGDFAVLSSNPGMRRYTIAPESLALRPGMTQQGNLVLAVEYSLGESIRATYWI